MSEACEKGLLLIEKREPTSGELMSLSAAHFESSQGELFFDKTAMTVQQIRKSIELRSAEATEEKEAETLEAINQALPEDLGASVDEEQGVDADELTEVDVDKFERREDAEQLEEGQEELVITQEEIEALGDRSLAPDDVDPGSVFPVE